MSSKGLIAIPPTIPPDNQFTTNSTRLQKILETLTANSISVSKNPPADTEFSVLSNGSLSNVYDPVDPQDAATLAYVLANAGGGIPGGSQNNVQFNDGGVFGGSSDLTYDGNALTMKSLDNGSVIVGNGTVNNLPIPTASDQAATKGYAESGFNITRTTNNTVGPVNYTASEVVNGIITRNITGGSVITDNLPTAAELIALVGDTIGTTFQFHIYNSSTDFDSIVRIDDSSMGTDVTLEGNPQNIYPGYQYYAIGKVTSATEIELIVMNNNRIMINDSFNYRVQKTYAFVNNIQCTDYNVVQTNPYSDVISVTEYSQTNFGRSIKPNDLIEQRALITIDCTGTAANSTDTTNNRIVLQDGWLLPNFNPGYWDFYITNPSTSTESIVFDETKDDFGDYNLNFSQNIYSIPPGKTGWYMVTWNNSTNSGYLYSLGIFDQLA